MHPISIIGLLLLALGAVEGSAYWWMHPAPAGRSQPVLTYRPVGLDRRAGRDSASDAQSQGTAEANAPASLPNQKSKIINHQSTISSSLPSSLTPLPDIYAKAAPMLRCSSGQVFHVQLDDTLGLHLAFFEWDGTDTGSVLEAFRHMPEACMGSIGMKLIQKAPPRSYVVRTQETGDRDQQMPGAEPNSKLKIQNSKLATQSLSFDHTIFRESGQGGGLAGSGSLVHAFRAVWVSGLSHADARQGLGGDDFDRLRTIRLKSALTRFRPTHARVIQGAVRGAANADAAWHAFEQTMLKDLAFERPTSNVELPTLNEEEEEIDE